MRPSVNSTGPFRTAEGILFQPLEREAVFLNLKSEKYFGLDPVGTRIWSLLVETQDVELTVQTLLREYDVEEIRLRNDVAALIGRMQERGLLDASR
jgi:predicted DNA-binding transcriptional regulator